MAFKMTDGTKLSTKDKIINSAFSFYTTVLQRKVSLSEIAERTGITKAAIYKHFKSREELEQVMAERLRQELLSVILEFDKKQNSCSSTLEEIIVLLYSRKTYLYYFLSNLSEIGIEDYFLSLSNSGLHSLNRLFDENGKIVNFDLYKDVLYVSFCIIFFIIARDKIVTGKLNLNVSREDYSEEECNNIEEIRAFARGVVKIIEGGVYCTSPRYSEEKISGLLRLCQLDKIISANMAYIPEPDRELKALASCAEKIGFTKITVESIAHELGLAKSSLYSRFSSKKELVSSTLRNTLMQMFAIVVKNIENSESPSESIYIILKTSFDFFLKRPDLIILSRLIQFTEENFFWTCDDRQQNMEFYKFLCNCDMLGSLPDFGRVRLGADCIYSALFCLPVYLITQTSSLNFTVEELQFAIKEYYYMLVIGKQQGKGE